MLPQRARRKLLMSYIVNEQSCAFLWHIFNLKVDLVSLAISCDEKFKCNISCAINKSLPCLAEVGIDVKLSTIVTSSHMQPAMFVPTHSPNFQTSLFNSEANEAQKVCGRKRRIKEMILCFQQFSGIWNNNNGNARVCTTKIHASEKCKLRLFAQVWIFTRLQIEMYTVYGL